MLHVLLLVPRPLWPERSGGEIRIASLIRALAGRWRFTVLSFGHKADGPALEAAMALGERATGARMLTVTRTLAPPPEELPALARYHHDPAMTAALERAAREDPPDLIQLEFTQMAQYAAAGARLAPVVLTEHDSSPLFAGRSYVRAEHAPKGEAARLRAYLRRAFSLCARVVTVSAADARRLSPLAPRGRLAAVPTGVDLRRFPFAGPRGRRPGEVVFVGHYPHFPNEDAAVHLCRDILPLLRRRVPGVRARLVGSGPSPAVRALAGPGVEVVGEVEDVGAQLRRASLFLAPLRLGHGIKGKVLEAFASGTPAAAYPSVRDALPGARAGRHLLTGAGARGLAAAAARALTDPALAARLAREARAYAEARFSWERQAALLEEVYRGALASRGPGRA